MFFWFWKIFASSSKEANPHINPKLKIELFFLVFLKKKKGSSEIEPEVFQKQKFVFSEEEKRMKKRRR